MNISGSLNVFKLFTTPSLCLPHHTISTFDQLPIPLSQAFTPRPGSDNKLDIRAVVLDKDNCFAKPRSNVIHEPYQRTFQDLRRAYPGSKLLIVSNSAGTNSDPGHAEADLLERNTGVKVLRHSTKKPGCHGEVMNYLRNAPDADVTSPSQVAVVGDRLFTDVMLANLMGSYGVWVKEGVVPDSGIVGSLPWQKSASIGGGTDADDGFAIAVTFREGFVWLLAEERLCGARSTERFRVSGAA